jgi:hypothetical protein
VNATSSIRPLSRTAGWLYLTIIACGMFAEVAVRSRLVAADDPATTAANLLSSSLLFRLGMLADLVMMLCDVALAILLLQLLGPLNRTVALLASAFRMTQTAIIALNLLNMFLALHILEGANDTPEPGIESQKALAMLFLDAHKYGYILGLAFFGVSTLLLAYLFCCSRPLPRALGILLGLAGVGYLGDCLMFLMISGYEGSASSILLAPALLAEVTFAVWLLRRGGRLDALRMRQQATASLA